MVREGWSKLCPTPNIKFQFNPSWPTRRSEDCPNWGPITRSLMDGCDMEPRPAAPVGIAILAFLGFLVITDSFGQHFSSLTASGNYKSSPWSWMVLFTGRPYVFRRSPARLGRVCKQPGALVFYWLRIVKSLYWWRFRLCFSVTRLRVASGDQLDWYHLTGVSSAIKR